MIYEISVVFATHVWVIFLERLISETRSLREERVSKRRLPSNSFIRRVKKLFSLLPTQAKQKLWKEEKEKEKYHSNKFPPHAQLIIEGNGLISLMWKFDQECGASAEKLTRCALHLKRWLTISEQKQKRGVGGCKRKELVATVMGIHSSDI